MDGTPSYNNEYVSESQSSANSHTYVFKKSCAGIIGANNQIVQSGSVSGTISLSIIPNTTLTYSETFYRFVAVAGQTVTFTKGSYAWIGYEIII